MTKFKMTYASGSTPLDPNEILDLIPDYISTMEELNQVEQSNISDAFVWAENQDLSALLTGTFIFKLHERMFNQVWKWAGKIRKSNKNLGASKESIMNDLGQLLNDTEYWIKNKTFINDELAVRFHHRLVQIHIFTNGNGRHARLMTDLLLVYLSEPKFSWGTSQESQLLNVEGKTRNEYLKALRQADQGQFKTLIQFARN